MNSLSGIRPADLADLRRFQAAHRAESEAKMDELVGGTLLGMGYLINAPLAFAITMTGIAYESFHVGLQIPTDQDTIVHTQAYLRNWSPQQSTPFPYQFIWEVDAHRNSNEHQNSVFQARMERFDQQVNRGKALLQRYPTEDPILQVSLLYRQLYGDSCVRNYDFYLNRPSRLFDEPRAVGQRGCGNCDARAQAQLAFYLAAGVQMSQGNPPRYLFAAQHRSDHDELVVFDTHTRKVWNPMGSLGNAQSVLWENPAGDVYRIEYWMQAYLIGRDQYSPLSWENLILARSTAPASERGIANWDNIEASPFSHPSVRQAASQGQTIPESEITPMPPSSLLLPVEESAPEIPQIFTPAQTYLFQNGSLSFIINNRYDDQKMIVRSEDRPYFDHASDEDQNRFLLRNFAQDLERMTASPDLRTFAHLIEQPENLETLLSSDPNTPDGSFSLINHLNQTFGAIQENINGLSIRIVDANLALPLQHPFRRMSIRWVRWINQNPAFVAQVLSRLSYKSRESLINIIRTLNDNQQAPPLNTSLLSQIRLGTPLFESRTPERNRYQITAIPAQPDFGPVTLQVNLTNALSRFDPRQSSPSPVNVSPPRLLEPDLPRIPLDIRSILSLINELGANADSDINRIWTPQASQVMRGEMAISFEVFLVRILPALLRTRFATQVPQRVRNDFERDSLNHDKIRLLLPYLNPEIRSLVELSLGLFQSNPAQTLTISL